MVVDRQYEDMDEDELLEAHNILWRSLYIETEGDKLNLLLEYERELAFREKEK